MGTNKLQCALVGWRIWPQWVLANAVAGAVALAVTGAMMMAGSLNTAVVVAVFGLVIGAALGIAQWFVLRRWIPQTYLWIFASIGGGAILAVLGFAMSEAVGGPLGGVVIGASLGTMQWLVLRRWVSQAYLYLLASTAGFALALSAGEAVGFTVDGAAGWLVGGTTFGIVAGIITGLALVWLLSKPISDI